MMRSLIYGSLLSIAIACPVFADDPATAGQCTKTYNQCQNNCDEAHSSTTTDRITCITACSGAYAACDAGVALEKAKPWLEDQARKTRKFLDDLLKSLPKGSSEPQPQNKSNSI